jgi:hypothetical protein
VLARIAEATLRDELRGSALLDDGVRAALVAARAAGSSVSMLDEGGLDGIDAARRRPCVTRSRGCCGRRGRSTSCGPPRMRMSLSRRRALRRR